jgi:hypothetical protein
VSILLVQHANKNAGTVTSTTLAYPSNVAAGDLLLVVVRSGGTTGLPFTVSDTLGNTWTGLTSNTFSGTGSTQIWWAISNGAGANTVTVGLNASNTLRIAIYGYSGAASSSPVDVENNSNTAASGNASAVSITPARDGELVIAFVATSAGTTATAGANFALEDQVPAAPSSQLITQDWIQGTATATTGPMTITGGVAWMEGIAAFKAAPASGGIAPPVPDTAYVFVEGEN